MIHKFSDLFAYAKHLYICYLLAVIWIIFFLQFFFVFNFLISTVFYVFRTSSE